MDSPIDKLDQTDPGDVTLRKFRYQHAYGVVLLCGIVCGKLDYKAILCEQHEDFLGEVGGELVDAFQVKTRKSEQGLWKITHEAFWKSISRFVDLDIKFPKMIRSFFFVSNTEYYESTAGQSAHLSPIFLTDGIILLEKVEGLSNTLKKSFDALLEKINKERTDDEVIKPQNLFDVLKRLKLVCELTERAFAAELSQIHISTLPKCSSLGPLKLAEIRDAFIAKIAEASSLVSEDSSIAWTPKNIQSQDNPFLKAKRICIDDVKQIIDQVLYNKFEFPAFLSSLNLGNYNKKLDILKMKMERGGLVEHFAMMRRRTITAEYNLLKITTNPDEKQHIFSQLENMVYSICDDVYLRSHDKPEPFGVDMLIKIQNQIQLLIKNNDPRIYQQPYDTLLGIVGMLTEDCKVRWSKHVELKD